MYRKQSLDLGDFMTAGEVAKYFGIDRMLVYQWSARGKLHPTTVGRAVLFDRAEVRALRREIRKTAKHRSKDLLASQVAVARSGAMPNTH